MFAVEFLLNAHASPNVPDPQGETALFHAIRSQNKMRKVIIPALIRAKAEVDHKNQNEVS